MGTEDEELARKMSMGYGQATGQQPMDTIGAIIKAMMQGPGTFQEGAQYITQGIRQGGGMLPGLTYAGPKAAGYATAPRKFSNLMDKMPRFEISDEAISWVKFKKPVTMDQTDTLGNIIKHEELFKQYPSLKNIRTRVTIDPNLDQGLYGGHFSGLDGGLNVIAHSEGEAKNTIVHEIQHAIQEYEGFAMGGSPSSFTNVEAINMGIKMGAKNPSEARQLGYKKLAGEIESRDASFRRLYSEHERATTQPYASQNIPVEEAIVKFGDKQPAKKLGLDLETGQWMPID